MEALFVVPQPDQTDQTYPALLTFCTDGQVDIAVPNFQDISYCGGDFNQGLMEVREKLQEELLTCIIPPQSIPVNQIPTGQNQQVILISPVT